MNSGKLVFAQITQHLPLTTFRRCVARYGGDAQGRELLLSGSVSRHGVCSINLSGKPARHRVLSASSGGQALPHGNSGRVSRSTLADANETRDWRIFADFAQALIARARQLYRQDEPSALELEQTVYALDSTPSTCVWRCFLGPSFVGTKARSSCTRCWICAATSLRSSTSPGQGCTMSTSSTFCFPSPVPSTSWIVAMSTSLVSTAWLKA